MFAIMQSKWLVSTLPSVYPLNHCISRMPHNRRTSSTTSSGCQCPYLDALTGGCLLGTHLVVVLAAAACRNIIVWPVPSLE